MTVQCRIPHLPAYVEVYIQQAERQEPAQTLKQKATKQLNRESHDTPSSRNLLPRLDVPRVEALLLLHVLEHGAHKVVYPLKQVLESEALWKRLGRDGAAVEAAVVVEATGRESAAGWQSGWNDGGQSTGWKP